MKYLDGLNDDELKRTILDLTYGVTSEGGLTRAA